MHGSVSLAIKKPNPKKRPAVHVNCDSCNSTFESKLKLKKHIQEQHKKIEEEEREPSPPRKALRGHDLDTRLDDEDTEIDNIIEKVEGRN